MQRDPLRLQSIQLRLDKLCLEPPRVIGRDPICFDTGLRAAVDQVWFSCLDVMIVNG